MPSHDFPALPDKPRYPLLLRLGMWRGVAAITTFSILASIVVTALIMLAIGVPDRAWPSIFWSSVLVPLCVASAVGIFVMRMVTQLDTARRQVDQMAVTDGLTGLCNRRHFMDLANAEFIRASRQGLPLSVMMVDADHFKTINDVHGHASGDEVLRRIPIAVKHCVRDADLLARYGGEEFVMLLPLTGAKVAAEVAERVRAGVAALRVDSVEGEALRVTVSVGLATLNERAPTLGALLNAADKALYRAKAGGRNRVEVADAGLSP